MIEPIKPSDAKVAETKMSDKLVENKWIAMLRSSEIDRVMSELVRHVDVADLCDDKDVTTNPIETHPHCTIAYGVPALDDSVRSKIETITRAEQISCSIEGLLVFPIRDKLIESKDASGSTAQCPKSYDFLVIKLKPSPTLDKLGRLILSETGTKDPHEDGDGNHHQLHATVCILKSEQGTKYLRSDHCITRCISKAIETYRTGETSPVMPIVFDTLVWARDGDRSAPTIDLPLCH